MFNRNQQAALLESFSFREHVTKILILFAMFVVVVVVVVVAFGN